MCIFRKFKVLLLTVLIFLVLSFGKSALAADIILNDLAGQPVNISSYQGKPRILFFWTTWCPYCRGELKKLNHKSSQIAEEGIFILGINVSESDRRVKRFLEGYQLNFKMLLDKIGLLADQYDLLGVPMFILLDKTGQVVSRGNSLPDNYKSLLFR